MYVINHLFLLGLQVLVVCNNQVISLILCSKILNYMFLNMLNIALKVTIILVLKTSCMSDTRTGWTDSTDAFSQFSSKFGLGLV